MNIKIVIDCSTAIRYNAVLLPLFEKDKNHHQKSHLRSVIRRTCVYIYVHAHVPNNIIILFTTLFSYRKMYKMSATEIKNFIY